MTEPIVVIGAGGFARQIPSLVRDINAVEVRYDSRGSGPFPRRVQGAITHQRHAVVALDRMTPIGAVITAVNASVAPGWMPHGDADEPTVPRHRVGRTARRAQR